MESHTETGELKRVFGLPTLVVYGVGDILGAGIYAVIGKIAERSGSLVWASFIVAMIVASLTALSYAELGGRLPKCGGVAYFVHTAFRMPWLSTLVGWLMFCTCLISMATISRSFAGYFPTKQTGIPEWLVIIVFLAGLAYVNFRGMKESSALNIVCTTMEVSGLILVILISAAFLLGGGTQEVNPTIPEPPTTWVAIAQGAALAFYAFIGFEDIVNVAEEVKNPERNVPRAIVLALGIAGVVYILVSWLSVQVVQPGILGQSGAPLIQVVQRAQPNFPTIAFTVIFAFAVLNTALLNFITASRLVYGMAREGLLPNWLGYLHPERRTPYRTFLIILPIVIVLALSGTIQLLAGATATLILVMFFLVNLSLVVIKSRTGSIPGFQVPIFVPAIAMLLNLGLVFFASSESHRLSLGFLVVGVVLILINQSLNRGRLSSS